MAKGEKEEERERAMRMREEKEGEVRRERVLRGAWRFQSREEKRRLVGAQRKGVEGKERSGTRGRK
eukprot:753096-Hanusia_phi.AAC.3